MYFWEHSSHSRTTSSQANPAGDTAAGKQGLSVRPLSRAKPTGNGWSTCETGHLHWPHPQTDAACGSPVVTSWRMPFTRIRAFLTGFPYLSVTTPLMPRCTWRNQREGTEVTPAYNCHFHWGPTRFLWTWVACVIE